jgi:hypothetical protein
MNDELEAIGKEAARYLPGGTEEYYEKPRSG